MGRGAVAMSGWGAAAGRSRERVEGGEGSRKRDRPAAVLGGPLPTTMVASLTITTRVAKVLFRLPRTTCDWHARAVRIPRQTLLSLLLFASVLGCGTDPVASDVDAVDAVTDASVDGGADAGPTGPPVETLDLGTVQTAADGLSQPLTFALPADVTAVTVVLRSEPDVELQIAAWDQPGAIDVVPVAWLQTAATASVCLGPCANRVLAQPGVAAFLAPNTPLITLQPGTHRLRFFAFRVVEGDEKPAAVPISVTLHRVRPAPDRRRLPLNIALTGAGGLDAAKAPESPALQAALAEVGALLGAAGLVVGPIRYYDVDSNLRFVTSRHGPTSDLAKLLASGAGFEPGINVFLVEQIWLGGGGIPGLDLMLGVAGGIPGDPVGHDHARAGIAIAWGLGTEDDGLLGHVMAHELGHFLGLFHTTEAANGNAAPTADPLPDTPVPAPKNLMHWSVTQNNRTLSHEQAQVLRRSPALQPTE
ncbi:MAG: hypothetical protein RIT45_2905 [Pseudomonadota bacterium]